MTACITYKFINRIDKFLMDIYKDMRVKHRKDVRIKHCKDVRTKLYSL